MKFMLARKINMTQVFNEDGDVVPVTIIKATPSVVTQIKMIENDGYSAVQIGFEKITKAKKIKKSMAGKEFKHLREFKTEKEYKVADLVDLNQFEEGQKVMVSGISKGKGFQGVVKRHGFHGQIATHGFRHTQRTPGSIGTTGMDKVMKGRKMPGRMGNKRISIKGLKIIKIDAENNLLFIKGSVPGRKNTLLEVKGI